MTTTTQAPSRVLRGLLKYLKTPKLSAKLAAKPTVASSESDNNKKYFNSQQHYVMEQYKAKNSSSSSIDKSSIQLAENFLKLQQDLAERARLYQLDTGAEVVLSPKEMSRRAAARAGLQMPKMDD